MSVCGHNHNYQTFVLCTQAVLAICHMMSIFAIGFFFQQPDFLCFSETNSVAVCSKAQACSSRYGYKLQSNFTSLLEFYGKECQDDSAIFTDQALVMFFVALFLGIFFYNANALGRKSWLLISSILQVWGNLIICFSFDMNNALWGVGMIILAFLIWAIYLFVYVYEILEKKSISLAIGLILLLGSLGFFLDMLIIALLRDFRGVSIFCMILHSLASLLYIEYIESPQFLYWNSSLGQFYSSLKHILQTNYGMTSSNNRVNALKGIIFNTDDSSYWISNLLEGKLPPSMRPKDLPKPTKHFLDDSQFDFSQISVSSIVIEDNHKTFSAKAPNDKDFELKMIEQELFNEKDSIIEQDTMALVYDIQKSNQALVNRNSKSDLIRNQLSLGAVSLLTYHILCIFLSFSFLNRMDVFPPFWNNLIFALAIFLGILFACIIAPEHVSQTVIMVYLLVVLVVCLNFATIEHSENNMQQDKHFISIPYLMCLHSLIISTIVSSSLGFLLIYLTKVFDSKTRAPVLGFSFAFSCLLISLLKFWNFGNIFENGLELNLLFFFTLINVIVVYMMPDNKAVVNLKKLQS
jgi:hypothetical protein